MARVVYEKKEGARHRAMQRRPIWMETGSAVQGRCPAAQSAAVRERFVRRYIPSARAKIRRTSPVRSGKDSETVFGAKDLHTVFARPAAQVYRHRRSRKRIS